MARLALICAGGAFPLAIAKRANNPFLILLKEASPELKSYDHITCTIAQLGRMIWGAKNAGCTKIAFVGSLIRPDIFSVIPDFYTLSKLPLALKAFRGGDNHLLTSFATLFEKEGLELIGVHEIAPDLLAPEGLWGNIKPDETDLKDIILAQKALLSLSDFDIGQALVISNEHIIAVEGAEGTDGLLNRVAEMRANGRVTWRGKRGILVKALKASQDKRLDMPALGVRTLENAHASGLKGIAMQANSALVHDDQAMIQFANEHKMFIYGFTP